MFDIRRAQLEAFSEGYSKGIRDFKKIILTKLIENMENANFDTLIKILDESFEEIEEGIKW